MKFTKISKPPFPTYWISGIYKIVSYRRGEYHAYFIRDGDKNWGWDVSIPPDYGKHGPCWKHLKAAKAACEEHAKTHTPSRATVKRAAEIKAKLEKTEGTGEE